MPELKWTRPTTFIDGAHDVEVHGAGVYDVPDGAVEDYLDHRTGGWERPDEDGAEDEQDGEDATDTDDDRREDMIGTVENGTVEQVAEFIEDGDYDGRLDELAEVEARFGGDRTGVHEAIEERREETTTGTSDGASSDTGP